MKYPRGKGWFIWMIPDCEGGSPERIAQAAVAAGIGHVLIKIADGTSWRYNVVNGVDLVPPAAAALREVGVDAWGWGFVYGINPAGEARLAVGRMLELELEGYVSNAEAQYRDLPDSEAAATQYTAELRRGVGMACPLGLSSFRYPSKHPRFPWLQFLSAVDFNMPQVYWMGATNAGAQLRQSVAEFEALAVQRPILPTGAAFKEWGWAARPEEIVDFLRTAQDLGIPAVNFWEWGRTRRDLPLNWQAVAAYPWPEETPPVEPAPEITLRLRTLQGMNVRSGPSIRAPIVGSLAAGTVLTVQSIGGEDAWVEFEPGRFAAVRTGGKTYMVKEQPQIACRERTDTDGHR